MTCNKINCNYMAMKNNRVLITGGAGFLGSHLCDHLIKKGYEVICLDNFYTGTRHNIEHLLQHPRFKIIHHDVIDPIILDINEIYHLACPASPIQYQRYPVNTIRTCVQGTLNMLNLSKEVGARFLLASSSEVYGDPSIHPQPENYWGNVNPIGERACYDEGKRCAEALVVSYAKQYGVEIKIARIFNTYGPRLLEGDGRVVSSFIVQALNNEPLTIFGDGSQTRSFCYSSDLIKGLVLLMSSNISVPVNLGNPEEITVSELANTIISLSDSKSTLVYRSLPADDPVKRRPDISIATKYLEWSPNISLDSGLKATISYFHGSL